MVTGAKVYAGKPWPAVILQVDRFDATESITICVMTTDPAEARPRKDPYVGFVL